MRVTSNFSKPPSDQDNRVIPTSTQPDCDPGNPRPENARTSWSVTSNGQIITIFLTRQACGHTLTTRHELHIINDTQFQFYGDVSAACREALFGIGKQFMYFARWGFDREA